MPQKTLKVRVRPPRIIVLLGKSSPMEGFLLAVKFLCGIWAGRNATIIPVQADSCDPEVATTLSSFRPDYVFGVGIDDHYWQSKTSETCQPRAYRTLKSESITQLRDYPSPERIVGIELPLVHRYNARHGFRNDEVKLTLVNATSDHLISAICQAYFGIHLDDVDVALVDSIEDLFCPRSVDFVEAVTKFASENKVSWLDLSGHELHLHIKKYRFTYPTIVLVGEDTIGDLAHFWNVRSSRRWQYSASVLPVPWDSLTQPAMLSAIKRWLEMFASSSTSDLHFTVTSKSVSQSSCNLAAEELRSYIVGKGNACAVKRFAETRPETVIAYEYESNCPVSLEGRVLTVNPPKSQLFHGLGGFHGWFVDLVHDVRTGRAIEELSLPLVPAVKDLLNGCCPPGREHRAVPRCGVSVDVISLHFYSNEELVRVYLPDSEEIFVELLREYGIEATDDEKRKNYSPVISRFGGLKASALAIRGKSGEILRYLSDMPRRELGEIKQKMKLGNGSGVYQSNGGDIGLLWKSQSDRIERINRSRLLRYEHSKGPKGDGINRVLDHWVERGVVRREWKVPACPLCGVTDLVVREVSRRMVRCSSCRNRFSSEQKLTCVYSVRKKVGLAIKEGIGPVVLAGRFLQNSTSNGFLWLPGFKYRDPSGNAGDLDIVALCDGQLVFAECKSFWSGGQLEANWDKTVQQFIDTISIAKRCKAGLAVFASHADIYPDSFVEKVRIAAGSNKLPILLLNRLDLENGFRTRQDTGAIYRFEDFLAMEAK